LNEFLDLLDRRCNIAFQDSTPKRVAHHSARERGMMDDSQYTSFQVSGELQKLPTTGELAMSGSMASYQVLHGVAAVLFAPSSAKMIRMPKAKWPLVIPSSDQRRI
jgi:hypothetical protein